MKHATLCIIKTEDKILLGLKKRGFGQGKLNGFGGKVKEDESLIDAAIRELAEESGLRGNKLLNVGELSFFFRNQPDWNQVVHLFLVEDYSGEPVESEEMKPEWHSLTNIPYHLMWDDDQYWLPLVLQGKKIIGRFIFKEDNTSIDSHEVKEVAHFSASSNK